ncbi:tail fiber protein [Nostoc sp. CENA67]|uniref:Tail fiber protein n=1 Tax=Amazonocrinis nigriterrae CENA67 TaxID=2794033 RepID=A0A8J7LCN8_9NOST|nr:tail fiber protein [Amazonocrinis nigriterrae]MBH8566701.1 tail fiber protein [Amazonocrinis nigriterrae CENA67]
MTQITGKFVDSGGVAFDGDLTLTLDAPLIDIGTTPDSIYTLSPHTFTFSSGTLSGVNVVESATSNVTYHLVVNKYTSKTTYWLADGTQYDGPVVVDAGLTYTGTFYDAATSQRLGIITGNDVSVVMDFHAIIPNVASVEFADLIPTRISTDSLPRTVRAIAELLTSDPDFVEALRGGPRFRGAYAAATYYQRDDAVTYGGSSWVYINSDPAAGQTPSTLNTTYWQILAQKGDPGGTGGNDTAYDATGWNGAIDAPSRNAVRDIIETLARISQLANYAILDSPAFINNPTCPLQLSNSNNTRIANTAYVDSAIAAIGVVPIGGTIAWITNSAPSKWLICDGRAISRTTYAALYAVVGAIFGSGDGSTTFNLPDLRGRVPVGADSSTLQGAASRITASNTLGASAGAQTHTLITNEIPPHAHPKSVSGGVADGSSKSAMTDIVGTTAGANVVTANTGGGAAHNNLQPYLIINWIIYAGV